MALLDDIKIDHIIGTGLLNKLLFIQETIVGLGKDKTGSGYKYVSGDKVLDNFKPLMCRLKLLLKPEVTSIENSRQDYFVGKDQDKREKSEILSRVMQVYTWIDVESGEREACIWGANGQNGWDKGVGSAMTYGERYFFLKFFHLETDKDDVDNPERDNNKPENQPTGSVPAPEPVLPLITPERFEDLIKAMNEGKRGVLAATRVRKSFTKDQESVINKTIIDIKEAAKNPPPAI